ncbi:MAG TPA: hypothetical protein VEO20_03845 [Thermoplasmata archaeon]|nr:hypothetical protein [Thermoplasmata archaeon]
MSDPVARPGTRPLIKPMRWLLYAASSLVFLAGLQLTVFSEDTATYFAWTISPFLTAAFLGAAYWAAVPVEVIAARQSSWANARLAVPAIWLFTTLTLVVTLVHFDKFHFSSPIASAQAAAWFWLAIYAGVPVAMLLVAWLQLRAPGGDPPPGPKAPTWMRVAVLIQGGGMLVVGVALLVAPMAVGSVWPWTLTALTGRAIGAWFVGIGFAAFHGWRENDFLRIRPLGGGYIAFSVLELIALGRYAGQVNWGPSAWVYLAFLLSILPVGLYGWFGHRSPASA